MFYRDRTIIGAGLLTIVLGICGFVLGLCGAVGTVLRALSGMVRELGAMPAEPGDDPDWSMLPWFACAAALGVPACIAGWRIVRGFARDERRRLRTGLWLGLGTSVGWFTLGQVAPGLWLSQRDAALVPTILAFLQVVGLLFCWPVAPADPR